MIEFEYVPIGTRARLEALETYARDASHALTSLAGNKPELMTIVAGERLADTLFCAARIESRIGNAGRQYRSVGGKR